MIAGKQPRMLSLVARHAAQWNAAWYGDPAKADELRVRLDNLGRALEDAGRDPSTIVRSAGIHVAFDGANQDTPDRAMRGTSQELAAMLAGYADLGISHLIAHVFPRTPDAVRSLGEAARLARERVPTPA